ncbi:hypothetical protein J6590_090041 [Homalodisca vitripennis]|nr:hypothetical protein J6590_090041 [Homalodisca vitripennis]
MSEALATTHCPPYNRFFQRSKRIFETSYCDFWPVVERTLNDCLPIGISFGFQFALHHRDNVGRNHPCGVRLEFQCFFSSSICQLVSGYSNASRYPDKKDSNTFGLKGRQRVPYFADDNVFRIHIADGLYSTKGGLFGTVNSAVKMEESLGRRNPYRLTPVTKAHPVLQRSFEPSDYYLADVLQYLVPILIGNPKNIGSNLPPPSETDSRQTLVEEEAADNSINEIVDEVDNDATELPQEAVPKVPELANNSISQFRKKQLGKSKQITQLDESMTN